MNNGIYASVAEPAILYRLRKRSRFFGQKEPRAVAAFFKAASAPFFRQAKKKSFVLVLGIKFRTINEEIMFHTDL